jgi:hypothetical protein
MPRLEPWLEELSLTADDLLQAMGQATAATRLGLAPVTGT